MTFPLFSITDAFPRTCVCGLEFVPLTKRQTHCSKECSRNQSRATKRANHEIQFIGVDGEGVNILLQNGDKIHRYVMLSVGDETLWNNGAELTHHEIFPFLYQCFLESPQAAYVGFFLGYDFTMWLKSLPENRARMLFDKLAMSLRKRQGANPTPFPVYVDGWEVDMLGMRRMRLRPGMSDPKHKNPNQWLYICDTGAYFQTAFLNVINPAKWPDHAPCTQEEYEIIRRGKENRGTEVSENDISYLSDMVAYNRLENRVLANTMSVLNSGFVAAGVKLKRDSFYGPGQAIQAYLDSLVKQGAYLPHKYLEEDLPDYVIESFRSSYYGGRFEIPYHGHLPGPTYEYDITSAYPHAMRLLPCLCSNNWNRGTGNPPNATIVLVYGTFGTDKPTPLGGLPFRTPKGHIVFPRVTKGWYLKSEIDAAIKAGLIDFQHIEQWVTFTQGCDHEPPLASLAKLFDTRLKIGKQTAQGKAIKLMLNSAYGKFAQSIGSPKYGNPVYATMITSKCREMILDAIATHPVGAEDVVMIATDGIYFKTPHTEFDALPDHEILGSWEPGVKQNMCLMKPGVYWDDSSRKAITNGEVVAVKSRGISAKALADNMSRIDQAFTDYHNGSTTELPSLDVEITFSLTSPSLALARGKWTTAGAITWQDMRTESASLAPKRERAYIDGPYIRSHPMTIPAGTETTAYNKRFGFIDREPLMGFDQEGSLDDTLRALLPQ